MKKNPLMNVVCEIRFESNQEDDVFCKSLIQNLEDRSAFKGGFVPLEIMNLPSEIRSKSGHLRFAPFYLNEDGCKSFGVGPHVLCFSDSGEYSGYNDFISFVKKGVDVLLESSDNHIFQIRLAYINRIDDNIAESTNLCCSINGNILNESEDYTFHIEYEMSEECNIAVRFCNKNAVLPENDNETVFSVVDLRAEYDVNDTNQVYEALKKTHNFIKIVFNKVMKQRYLKEKWGINV